MPVVISKWAEDELLNRLSPQLLKVIKEKPEQLNQLFQKLSRLGATQSFGETTGDFNISYTTQDGKLTTASYVSTAKLENGEARIKVSLIQLSGEGRFLRFYVESLFLLQ